MVLWTFLSSSRYSSKCGLLQKLNWICMSIYWDISNVNFTKILKSNDLCSLKEIDGLLIFCHDCEENNVTNVKRIWRKQFVYKWRKKIRRKVWRNWNRIEIKESFWKLEMVYVKLHIWNYLEAHWAAINTRWKQQKRLVWAIVTIVILEIISPIKTNNYAQN